jgi:hypothetical protein
MEAEPFCSAIAGDVMLPEENVTVPVGFPLLDTTWAVKVTDWPTFAGLRDEVIEALVAVPVIAVSTSTKILTDRTGGTEPCPG